MTQNDPDSFLPQKKKDYEVELLRFLEVSG